MTKTTNEQTAQKIAEMWMFSCDAPDDNETAAEISRLAQLIVDVQNGNNVKWRVVNHSLHSDQLKVNAHLTSRLSTLEAAVEERDNVNGKLRKALEYCVYAYGDAGASAVLAETAPKVQSEEANNGNAK